MASTPLLPPPPDSMLAVSPPASVAPSLAPPPPPPNSEVHVRTRANSHSSRHSQGSLTKRTGRDFAEYLTKVHEEMPGSFYECHTGVPENTPKTSVASHSVDGCSSPPSDRTNLQPTALNLPHIVERLEQLPPPAASRFSSPPSSVYGESSVGGPLVMAASRRVTSQKSTQTPSPFAGGVREHSDWANDIVQDVGRDLTRLANLAVDDNKRDPSRTVDAHYRYRLNLLLNDKHQKIIYGDFGVPPLPSTLADAGTPTPPPPRSIHASYVNWSEFKELKDRVDDLDQLIKQLSEMHSTSQQEINSLKADVAVLKKVVGGGSDRTKKENDLTKMI